MIWEMEKDKLYFPQAGEEDMSKKKNKSNFTPRPFFPQAGSAT